MKSNFFKAVLFGLAVLCGPAAAQNSESINADSAKVEQQVFNQIKAGMTHFDFAGTPKEAYQFLKENREDTLVTTPVEIHTDTTVTRVGHIFELTAQDTLYVSLRYSLDGPRALRRDTLCVLNQHVTEEIPVMSPLEMYVDSLSQLTKAWDKVSSGREQDRYGYRVAFSNGNEYTITTRFNDKFGWQMGPFIGGELADGILGATAGARLACTHKYLEGTLDCGIGYNRYEANAEEQFAGDQALTFDARAMGWFNIAPLFFKGDKYLVHRLEVGGGAGLKGFQTKSREVTNPDGSVYLAQSQGNAFYWAAGLKYTYRKFNSRQSWSVELDVMQVPNVWQNRGQQNHIGGCVKIAYMFDMFRNHARW
jgi:hypothetical protein